MTAERLRRLANASKRLDKATRDRNQLIRELRADAVPWNQIADAAGLHPNACMRIVKGQDAYR